MDDAYNWSDVAAHIDRHASGCWTWDGSPVNGNVYRIVAEAYGAPLPSRNGKYYRMPGCALGTKCVNPNHIGTGADFVLALNGRRQRMIPEPSRTVTEVRLTKMDMQFLKSLRIRWE
jgi:hypothetical protein